MSALHPEGRPPADVLADLRAMRAAEPDWRSGRIVAGVYDPGEVAYRLAEDAYLEYLGHNALYINFYPSIPKMEREVVRGVADLLRGDEQVVGSITSGGTESIILAVKATRDAQRARRPEVTDPEIVLPISAHPAFHKAAHYLGLRTVVTPIDPVTFRADVGAMQAATGPDTVLLVGSAPTYSHGVIDPIPEIAAVARSVDAFCHVDGCVGGIYLGLLRRQGIPVADFDFAVDGVTTISADLHKYGYVPRNSSVLLYRDRALRYHAIFTCTGTTEYAVINPTVQSTRTGGPIAAAWALFQHLGEPGYARLVLDVQEATQRIAAGVAAIPGLRVLAPPEMAMIAISSDEVNVFELDDAMTARGWSLQVQFAVPGTPCNLHLSVNASNVPHVDELLADLADATAGLRAAGPRVDRAALTARLAELQALPTDELLVHLAAIVGLTPDGLPADMAVLNTVLDLLPVPVRDDVLRSFVNLVI